MNNSFAQWQKWVLRDAVNELADNMNSIGDIKTGNGEMYKITNRLSIECRISK